MEFVRLLDQDTRVQLRPARELRRVLLIEDDKLDRHAITSALDMGLQTVDYDHVSTLQDVQVLAEEHHYDLILSDMSLPDSQGIQTIRSLVCTYGKTPIVVLSGTDDDAIALQAVHAGAQDYIAKQYLRAPHLINRTLRHAFERHQLKMGLEEGRDRERFLAHFDQCTGLPNRALLMDRLQQTVSQAQRNMDKFALLFIDLDGFKSVNDLIGHDAGDEVLHCVLSSAWPFCGFAVKECRHGHVRSQKQREKLHPVFH